MFSLYGGRSTIVVARNVLQNSQSIPFVSSQTNFSLGLSSGMAKNGSAGSVGLLTGSETFVDGAGSVGVGAIFGVSFAKTVGNWNWILVNLDRHFFNRLGEGSRQENCCSFHRLSSIQFCKASSAALRRDSVAVPSSSGIESNNQRGFLP